MFAYMYTKYNYICVHLHR